MKKQTYLFDFDGTLVDSMPTYAGLMVRILDENNIPYGEDIMKIITPLGFLGTAKYYKTLGIRLSEEEMVRKMNEYAYYEYANNIPAKSNVISVLEKLKSRGDGLNVLTASPHATLDACLKRLGIYTLFDNVWSCDDFNTTKTDVKIYAAVAKKIGAEVGEILFLDDNYNAVKTAKQAGMKTCGVFDNSSESYVDEMKALADHYIYDFSELIK